MKKFFTLLLCLLLAFPLFAAASPSRTVKSVITCEPQIQFEIHTELFDLTLEGYELLEALKITLDKPYEQVIWHITPTIEMTDQIKVAIINNDLILQDCALTEDCGIIVDFTDIEPGKYLLYFYRRKNV